MISRWLALIAVTLLVLAPTHAAAAPIYALFVGIGAYAPDSGVPALSGARADVAGLKAVLVSRYGLDPRNVRELYDAEATRDGIARALNAQIQRAAATAGGTVLFYYSGHGGQIADTRGNQSNDANSTLVPFDARRPGVLGDILDTQLDDLIKTANSWGVNVVTIFDSCNSATATRGIRPRHVRAVGPPNPSAKPAGRLPDPSPPPGVNLKGRPKGLRVHMGAAQDGEAAGESPDEHGAYRGDFTLRLEAALLDHPGATYEDLARIVSERLRKDGISQHPHAVGALTTRVLGSDAGDLPLYVARREDGDYIVEGGALANVTEGSQFAVYASVQDAREGKPLGKGSIAEAGQMRARLRLDAPANSGSETLYLLETVHTYPPERLAVGVDGPAERRQTVADFIGALPFAKLEAERPDVVAQVGPDGVRLVSPDGLPLTPPLSLAEIKVALGKVLRQRMLLALGEGKAGPNVTVDIVSDCPKYAFCPPLPRIDGEAVVHEREGFQVVARNREPGKAFYIYAFDLEPDLSINIEAGGREDQQGEAEQRAGPRPLVVAQASASPIDLHCGSPPVERAALIRNERTWFAVIASETPLPVEALEQTGVPRPKGVEPPSQLSVLLGGALTGSRAAVVAPPGSWTVRTVSLRVLEPDPPRPCPAQ